MSGNTADGTQRDSNGNLTNTQNMNTGIRLPPISFLGNLTDPKQTSTPPQGSSGLSSQMGLSHLVSSSQTDNSDINRSQVPPPTATGFQLPGLNESGFNQPLPMSVKQESEDLRSVYNLPTPVQLGIDVRRQNLTSEPSSIDNQYMEQERQLIEDRKLKEEKKRKNKQKREREKLLRQQQQMLYEQQQDLERRRAVEENERLNRVMGETVSGHEPYTLLPRPPPESLNVSQQQLEYQHQKHSYDDTQEEVIPFKKQQTTINNSSVLEDCEMFPRRHIGTILYQQFPTKSTVIRKLRLSKTHEMRLQEDEIEYHLYMNKNRNYLKNKPSKIISLLPPYLKYYINCLVDIKISYKDIVQNENVFKRNLWGTDVYTDDSDIVAILYHCGIIPSKSPFDSEDDKVIPLTPGNKLNNKSIQHLNNEQSDYEGDLIVTLLILPSLTRYQGSYRNNYNSRTWSSNHDGGSILLYNVKWCQFGDSYKDTNYLDLKRSALTDVALLKHQMEEDEKYAIETHEVHENKENKEDGKGNVGRLLNGWNFDKSYMKSITNPEIAALGKTDKQDEDEEADKTTVAANDTTMILNQTTQIQHTDDTTIPDITKIDDITIDAT